MRSSIRVTSFALAGSSERGNRGANGAVQPIAGGTLRGTDAQVAADGIVAALAMLDLRRMLQ